MFLKIIFAIMELATLLSSENTAKKIKKTLPTLLLSCERYTCINNRYLVRYGRIVKMLSSI